MKDGNLQISVHLRDNLIVIYCFFQCLALLALAAVNAAEDAKKPAAKNAKRSLEHIGLGTNLLSYSGLGGLVYGSGLGYTNSYGSKCY